MSEPYKFTDEAREEYLDQIRNGEGRGSAARNLGLSPSTPRLYAQEHPEFRDEVLAAERDRNEHVASALYATALKGNTTAQIFWLTNRAPDEWSDRRVPRIELGGPGGGPVQIDLSIEELRARGQAVLNDAREKRAKLESVKDPPQLPAAGE